MINKVWHGKLGLLRTFMLLAVIVLVATGMACISASGRSLEFNKQLFWLGLSLVVMFAVNHVHYRKLGKISMFLYMLTNVMLIVVLVGKHFGITSLVPEIGGSHRWITLGGSKLLRVQPSELAKLSFILSLSWMLRNKDCSTFKTGVLLPICFSMVPMVLILIEPDLGTFLLFIPVMFTIIFMAGAKVRHILSIILLALLCSPFGLLVIKDYQKARIIGLFKQNTTDVDWLSGNGYQLHKSKMSIGSGGIKGQRENGIFVKYPLLPDRHNDFIFAMIGHQWGLIGCCSILLLYFLIILGAIEISSSQPDPFGKLVAIGIAALMASQMFVNISMTIGLAPVTGMTLPFISYGGSSLVCNFIAIGLLINIARHHDYKISRSHLR